MQGCLGANELSASIAQLKQWARNPDLLITGAITRDANGAATSAPVTWPDGVTGTYTADTLSTAFPGAVDAYHITYGVVVGDDGAVSAVSEYQSFCFPEVVQSRRAAATQRNLGKHDVAKIGRLDVRRTSKFAACENLVASRMADTG